MRVVFAREAEADLTEIALFIARGNKPRALCFTRELRQAARQLGDMPRAFPLIPRYEHYGLRRRPYGNYLIFYRVEDDRLTVLHVLHGARDYERLLFPDE
ncbi:MAG: type II toxin-antitoxin system RelE/ParE family toxin [Acetobacteraceae bacterium]|nr:type II toxin-antitoxin system RelE/ParE family toxin [Acetobacteraceae bacterium]